MAKTGVFFTDEEFDMYFKKIEDKNCDGKLQMDEVLENFRKREKEVQKFNDR